MAVPLDLHWVGSYWARPIGHAPRARGLCTGQMALTVMAAQPASRPEPYDRPSIREGPLSALRRWESHPAPRSRHEAASRSSSGSPAANLTRAAASALGRRRLDHRAGGARQRAEPASSRTTVATRIIATHAGDPRPCGRRGSRRGSRGCPKKPAGQQSEFHCGHSQQ
jgi:hypothetical protein